ncbi:hypothetical protein ACSLBL_29125 [Klebsiella michiganensis]|uniref:hypothetical protein n=1 Tax=Klebsiella michiganensis TaxID=1134687 RepID=UPI003F504768
MAKTSAVTPEQAKQIEAVLRQRSEVAADAWKLNLQLALRMILTRHLRTAFVS